MSHDRTGHSDFQLTQEFLAIMLGVRRSSVTLAFGALSRADLIDHATTHLTAGGSRYTVEVELYRAAGHQRMADVCEP